MSKHQIRSGDGRWEERRGVGRLNPRRETKTKGRNGDKEKEIKEEVTDRRKFLARKRRRRGRAERRLLRRAKGGIEHMHVGGKSQLPHTTYGRWQWMGNTELDGR